MSVLTLDQLSFITRKKNRSLFLENVMAETKGTI